MNYNKIHIGQMIEKRASECRMDTSHICSFLKITEDQTNLLFRSENISTEILLRLSKFLDYDFFRIYSQHIILYAPPKASFTNKSVLPPFSEKHLHNRDYKFHYRALYIGRNDKTTDC